MGIHAKFKGHELCAHTITQVLLMATRDIPTEYSEAEPSSEVKDGLRCHKFECSGGQ